MQSVTRTLSSFGRRIPLPKAAAEIWQPSRDFAHAKLPSKGAITRLGISS